MVKRLECWQFCENELVHVVHIVGQFFHCTCTSVVLKLFRCDTFLKLFVATFCWTCDAPAI